MWSELHEPLPRQVSVVHATPSITIHGNLNHSNVLPLHTGDRIAISCDISQGEKATMLWFNPNGELKIFEPVRDVAEKIDRLVYPAPHEEFTLGSPEGTDIIVFCRGEPVAVDLLRACFPLGRPLPEIPAKNYLELRRSEVTLRGPLEKEGNRAEIHQLETILKDINRRLLEHCPGVTALAFPHHAATGNHDQ
jgi:hypothetical protein